MLIELNDNNVKEGVICLEKNEKGKLVARVIPFYELNKDTTSAIDSVKGKAESNKVILDSLYNEEMPSKIAKLTMLQNRIKNLVAFDLMLNDINYNGVDYPSNFKEISAWVLNPTEDIPDNFGKYLNQVEGGKEGE